jgi:hypothetical protein
VDGCPDASGRVPVVPQVLAERQAVDMQETVAEAGERIPRGGYAVATRVSAEGPREVVTDKGDYCCG